MFPELFVASQCFINACAIKVWPITFTSKTSRIESPLCSWIAPTRTMPARLTSASGTALDFRDWRRFSIAAESVIST